VLDEPLAALDVRSAADAGRVLATLLRTLAAPALLVTHDFMEAALLADEVAVIDAGAIVQRGTPAQLAAEPASAFVADLTGAVVLHGTARTGSGAADGLAVVELDGGGVLSATARASGPVAVVVHPWEIAIEPAGGAPSGSARNRLDVEIVTVTALGSRVRLGLAAPQPLAAEITRDSARRLGLTPGVRAVATWKAAATRLLPR
jgi:molybdate transport system ATP-binding protein